MAGLALLLAVSTAVGTWALAVEFHQSGGARDDFMFEGPDLSPSSIRIIGVVAAILACAIAWRLALMASDLATRGSPLTIVALSVAAGFIPGLTYGVATAPVSGANIGGGFLIMISVPAVVVLAVAILRRSIRTCD